MCRLLRNGKLERNIFFSKIAAPFKIDKIIDAKVMKICD